MSDTALLVIDVQESFRHRPYWVDDDFLLYIERQQALIDGCKTAGIPIVQIFHVEDEGAFSLASGHVRKMEELRIAPDFVVHKRYHSALAGSPLQGWLTERGIRRLIVSGIRTEQCCETTTRHAHDSGFQVDYITEATLTFPMTRNGKTFSTAAIKERTELVLDGRFARVLTVDRVLTDIVKSR